MSLGTSAARCLLLLAGLPLVACGDPSAGAPKAALNIALGGPNCDWPGAGTQQPIDEMTGIGQQLVGVSDINAVPLRLIIDDCKVAGSPTAGFSVSAEIDLDDQGILFSINTVTPLLPHNGALQPSEQPGRVIVRYQQTDRLTANGVASPNTQPCAASALQYLDTGGAALVAFDCPALEDPLTIGSSCTALNSRLILENCDTM